MYHCGGPSFGDEFQGEGEKIDSYPANSLTHIFIQENDLAIISATMESTSKEERNTLEMNSKAAVRGLIHILPYL